MSIQFEVIHRDIAGRTGKLKVGSKTVKTPLLLPVINPHIQIISPREMAGFGVEALITNAYIFYKSSEYRNRALEEGLHRVLDFDGVIMTDSGAFQQSVYGDVAITNQETIQFQRAIGSDILVPMDIATPPDGDWDRASTELDCTMQRIEGAMDFAPEGHLAAPVQGGIYPDLRKAAGQRVSELGVTFCPIGAVVPLMESYRYRDLVRMVMAAKEGLSPSACVHLFGAGHPSMLALAVAMGCDVFDSAAYALYAREGRYMTPHGSFKVKELRELPCACTVCRSYSADELNAAPDRERLLALHNLHVTIAEIARIRQSIQEGTLWEQVDERCRSHPRLLDGYRYMLNYTSRLEQSDRVSKRRFFYRGDESCRRTEVYRYHQLTERISAGHSVLITTRPGPCGDWDTVLHFKPPFGPHPPELAETFPIGQCELPEWDEQMVRSGCLGVRQFIKTHADSDITLACEERWFALFQRELAGLEVKYEPF